VTGDSSVGGLLGFNRYTVKNCYATGNVTGDLGVGGLVGLNGMTIENCYATGNVTGNDDVGGLLGMNDDSGRIVFCYSIGYVKGDEDFGGLVGSNREGIVENCFWDKETSSRSKSDGGTGNNTVEMMTKSTFTEMEWDFNSIWAINEYVNYPHLQWEMEPEIHTYDSDNDSIPDFRDDFPIDPAASVDTDYDGSPDKWNLRTNDTNSATGLHLDAFPLDPAASLDSDNDGMPDRWNPGMDQSDSTSKPPLELDPYPDDPDNEVPTEISLMIWTVVSLAVVFVLLIVVVIAVLVWRKRKPQEKEEKENLGRIEPDEK